ncbi:unnamed protein product [Allacma fusca]|uniref:Uncharacterized protein n=1 Tax=Allacma fusca TaxID=39272 RepID=A0A8J2KLS7_9HEXA|nr:unnamed protein product [Allacma fusca]
MGNLFSKRKKSVNLAAITNDLEEKRESPKEARHFHANYKYQEESDYIKEIMAKRARASEMEDSTLETSELAAKQSISKSPDPD